MPEDDPYANPYQTDALPPIADPGAATAAASQAGHFAQQHRSAISGREKEIRDIQEKQGLNVNVMTQMLDDTVAQIKRAREGRSNLPLMEMGAAMMSSPGNFGQQVGAGFAGLARGIKTQRDEDSATDLKLADLNLRRAAIANAPLETRLAYMKALQTGDIAALARIEAMQVKATAGGGTPADEKKYNLWKQDPANKDKSFAEYQQWEAGLKDRGTALQREFNLARQTPGKENMPWEDFLREKAKASAAGHAEGEDQGKTRAGLGQAEDSLKRLNETIDRMISHPGLDNAVGRMWATMKPIPGSPKADFVALEESLKGQIFLKAYNALRGAGAITEAEGLKATVSELADSRAQSKEAYLDNLRRYKELLQRSEGILRQRAGVVEKPGVQVPGAVAPPVNDKPTPPGQTGQSAPTPQPEKPAGGATAQEGQRVMGPGNKIYVVKDGKLVPE